MKQYPKYKDSGVSWIGEIPERWNTRRLKFSCNLIQEKTTDSSLPYIALENIESYSGKLLSTNTSIPEGSCNLYSTNDVLFSKLRPYLTKCVVAPSEGKCSSELLVLRDFEGENKYLQYLMLSPKYIEYIDSSTYGAKMPRANWLFIGNTSIPLPPLSEQHAIVSYLDKKTAQIDRFISEATKEIEKLNELKQTQIAHLVTHGTNPDAPMKDSGIVWIGQIPEHWEVRKMKFLFDERTEKNHPEEPILCATQAHGVIPQSMYDNRVVVVNTGFQNLKFVEVGDFVISLRSFQGGIEYAHYQGIISAAYTILRSKGDLTNDYTRYLFKSFPFIQLLKTCVKGIREGQNINYDMLKNNYLFVPPKQEQTAIVSAINSLNKRIDMLTSQLVDQINHLKELKQRIISDAVTGKIDVREVNN
ncbi:restriction endonuclease subunit S [Prevotella sp.]